MTALAMTLRSPRALLVLTVRLGLGGLFIVAGLSKLRDPAGFAQEIANYQLAAGLAPYLAMVLPPIEVVAGVALVGLSSSWRRAAALALGGLLVMFTVAVLHAVLRGVNIDCGCFGTGSGPVSFSTVLRNVGLLAAALIVIALDRPRASS